MGTGVRDMCRNNYFVKNNKNDNNSATTKGREKISTDLKFLEFFYVHFTLLKTIKFYLVKLATDF